MYNDNDATQHVLIGNLRACHFPYYVITGLSYISPRHDRGRTELRPSQSITSCHMTLNVYKLPHNQIFYVSAYQLSSLTPSSNRWCPQTSNSLETKIPPASSDSIQNVSASDKTTRNFEVRSVVSLPSHPYGPPWLPLSIHPLCTCLNSATGKHLFHCHRLHAHLKQFGCANLLKQVFLKMRSWPSRGLCHSPCRNLSSTKPLHQNPA